MTESYVLGDWGTTRLRLYRMRGGEVTARLEGPGTGALKTGVLKTGAADVLRERLETWLADGPLASVTICGMAGAPGGLVEAGYAPCPADVAGWLASHTPIEVAGVPVSVLPGLSCRSPDHDGAAPVPEVMRGEEAQVFGALALDPDLRRGVHRIVLPGTHSKWVELVDGTIRTFRTHPTGELFALLSRQSTLTGPDTPGTGTFDDGFARGLERCGEPLTAALFEARAARMLDGRSQEWSRGYISGLLIGGEVAGQVDATAAIVLIGDAALVALYERALTNIAATARRIDGDAAVIAGLELARGEQA